ncbi:MAG: metalloprotease TldD [Buchnera aphidicola (Chaetogeoica yunlongensis)]
MILDKVTESLLLKNNINHQNIFSVLSDISKKQIDYSDLYFQSITCESWILENDIIKEGTFNINKGIGVRVVSNAKTSFSYSNEISLDSLIKSSKLILNSIDNSILKTNFPPLLKTQNKKIYTSCSPFSSINTTDKLEILRRINVVAKNCDHRVMSVNAELSGSFDEILVASSDGNLSADIRPLIRLSVSVLVQDKGKYERGSSGGGSRSGYSFFLKKHVSGKILAEYYAIEAVRIALINLSAKAAPSGTFPVVLGPGWPGILLHEAVGHGLEGDFNRQGTSIFSDKIGQKVASKFCTVVDDGTLNNRRGSLTIDDEGVPGKYNVLIEEGILKKYLQDKTNARLMSVEPTGNGRRTSYAYLPLPRMTNTYLLSGKSTPQDIINSVDYGIYALNFSGGQVDITSGKFVFFTSEAYLIKKGKINKSIKNAMLIGSGMNAMKKISMVGNDLELDGGMGICVKNGQSIPVGVGQPTIKLDYLTVGGTH